MRGSNEVSSRVGRRSTSTAAEIDGTATTGRFGATATICSGRWAAMARAVELGVDREEFELADAVERAAWLELEIEHEDLLAREGPRWVAD